MHLAASNQSTLHEHEVFLQGIFFGDRIGSIKLVWKPDSYLIIVDRVVLFLHAGLLVTAVLKGIQEQQIERVNNTDDSQHEHGDGQAFGLGPEHFVEDDR